MAASVGLAATRQNLGSTAKVCQSSGLLEGAVVINKQTGDNTDVAAPSGANAINLAGVILDAQPSGGTTAGDYVNVQYAGIALCRLVAGATATKGNLAIVADTAGAVKQWTNETAGDVVGTFEQTLTAGSASDPIMVRLGIYRKT